MANKRITDVDFLESLNSDESFFVNHNNSIKQISRTNLKMQKQHGAVSVKLLLENWSNERQIVSVKGVTSNNTIIISPSPVSRIHYSESDVCCSAQENGTLTFECMTTPTEELTVNVLILD